MNNYGYLDLVRGAITKTGGPGSAIYTNTDKFVGAGQQGTFNDFSFGSSLMGNVANLTYLPTPSELGDPRTNNEQLSIFINDSTASVTTDGSHFVPLTPTLGSPNWETLQPATVATTAYPWGDYYIFPAGTGRPNATAATAAAVVAGNISTDVPLTSIGQLGDVFDPARLPGSGGISFSRGGGRTFKIGQHDDLYSNDPTSNVYSGINSPSLWTIDYVPASNSWASWRLADIFDVTDAIELPGRININGVRRDKGAALLAMLQGLQFQPATTTATDTNSNTYTPVATDPVIHGDSHVSSSTGTAGQALDTTGNTDAKGNTHGFRATHRADDGALEQYYPVPGRERAVL